MICYWRVVVFLESHGGSPADPHLLLAEAYGKHTIFIRPSASPFSSSIPGERAAYNVDVVPYVNYGGREHTAVLLLRPYY